MSVEFSDSSFKLRNVCLPTIYCIWESVFHFSLFFSLDFLFLLFLLVRNVTHFSWQILTTQHSNLFQNISANKNLQLIPFVFLELNEKGIIDWVERSFRTELFFKEASCKNKLVRARCNNDIFKIIEFVWVTFGEANVL